MASVNFRDSFAIFGRCIFDHVLHVIISSSYPAWHREGKIGIGKSFTVLTHAVQDTFKAVTSRSTRRHRQNTETQSMQEYTHKRKQVTANGSTVQV